jgi:predicted ATPase
MIEEITIRNFKSLARVTVKLSPVTVLIGRSGVGKSNFLRAIRFLRNYLLQGPEAINNEGGWPRIWPFGTPAPLSFSVQFRIPGFDVPFAYHVAWKPHPQQPQHVALDSEMLKLGAEVIFERGEKLWIKWPGGNAPRTAENRLYLNAFPTISEAVLAYTAWSSGIGWHDFPADVFGRGTTFTHSKFPGLDDAAGNYLQIIRDITQDLRDQHSRRQILARIKQINASVQSLELDSILDPKRVIVAHTVGDRRIGLDLSQESDGFRRYYAHLLALYQTPPKQLLMFEEPENGIYPGALRNLADEFKDASRAGRGQILLTTQSPDLLDGFAPEQLRVVELDKDQFTQVGPLDAAQAEALRTHLLEPGELLTVDRARSQLTPS